jgi:hypothetical protein
MDATTYRLIPQTDRTVSVELTLPDGTASTLVGFAALAEADAWAARAVRLITGADRPSRADACSGADTGSD